MAMNEYGGNLDTICRSGSNRLSWFHSCSCFYWIFLFWLSLTCDSFFITTWDFTSISFDLLSLGFVVSNRYNFSTFFTWDKSSEYLYNISMGKSFGCKNKILSSSCNFQISLSTERWAWINFYKTLENLNLHLFSTCTGARAFCSCTEST